jgi:hypothetical protein
VSARKRGCDGSALFVRGIVAVVDGIRGAEILSRGSSIVGLP